MLAATISRTSSLINRPHTTLDSPIYGDSALERYPLFPIGSEICLVLPAAVSIAIRRMVIEWCLSNGYEDRLYSAYTREIAAAFSNVPILGDKLAPTPPFRKVEGVFNADMATWIDEGRLLHLCFLVDDFGDYDVTGTVGVNRHSTGTRRVG